MQSAGQLLGPSALRALLAVNEASLCSFEPLASLLAVGYFNPR